MRAQKRHVRRVAVFERMLGRNLRHHAIGRDHIKNIQPFENRRRQRNPSVILQTPIAGNVRIARPEGNESLEAIALGTLKEMAAPQIVQFHRRLLVDLLVHWLPQMPI